MNKFLYVLILSILSSSLVWADSQSSSTLSTVYPSPTGEYDKLSVTGNPGTLTTGSIVLTALSGNTCTPAYGGLNTVNKNGTLYYCLCNSSNNCSCDPQTQLCTRDGGTLVPIDPWTSNGTQIYPNPPSVNLGIGSNSPGYPVDLGGNVLGMKIALYNNGAGLVYGIGTDNNSGSVSGLGFYVESSASPKAVLTRTGLGINLPSGTLPTHAVDVVGDINATTDIFAANVNALTGVMGGGPGTTLPAGSSLYVIGQTDISNGTVLNNKDTSAGLMDGYNYIRPTTIFADTDVNDKVTIGNAATSNVKLKVIGRTQMQDGTESLPAPVPGTNKMLMGDSTNNQTAGTAFWSQPATMYFDQWCDQSNPPNCLFMHDLIQVANQAKLSQTGSGPYQWKFSNHQTAGPVSDLNCMGNPCTYTYESQTVECVDSGDVAVPFSNCSGTPQSDASNQIPGGAAFSYKVNANSCATGCAANSI